MFSNYTGITSSDQEVKTKVIRPSLKLAVGYQVKNFTVEGDLRPMLISNVNSPKIIGGNVGYNINGFTPNIGYYFDITNSDNTKYNSKFFGYGLKYQWSINSNAWLIIDAFKAQKNYQLTFGGLYQIK